MAKFSDSARGRGKEVLDASELRSLGFSGSGDTRGERICYQGAAAGA